jgi:hypothetical protein
VVLDHGDLKPPPYLRSIDSVISSNWYKMLLLK